MNSNGPYYGKTKRGPKTICDPYLDENGVVHESTGREHIEELSNEAKHQQTSDTTFIAGALQEDVDG
jgi:hypothetical protein